MKTEMDPMEQMDRARSRWHYMAADERAAAAHDAIDIAVIALEEAYQAGKITKAGYANASLILGVACAHQHDMAD